MTMRDGTFCTILQGFPMLLILAQNYYRCLNTPLIYKPPTPTQSPEFLEAFNTLYQHLMNENNHGYGGDHYYGSGGSYGQGFYGHGTSGVPFGPDLFGDKYPTFSYGNKYPTFSHGNKYPTFSPGHGNKYPTFGYGNKYPTFSYKAYSGHGVQGYPMVYKKLYNYTSGDLKGYAPNQIYNVKHKYKIVVKKPKIHKHREMQKLQGPYPQQEERRRGYGFSDFLNPNTIRERLMGILHLRPENRNSNREYIFPFRRPGAYNDQGRPYQQDQNQYNGQYQNYPNQNGYYQQPVAFPTRNPGYSYNDQYSPVNVNGNMYQHYSQNNNLYPPNTQSQFYNNDATNNEYQTNNQYQPNNEQYDQQGNDNPIKNPNEEIPNDHVNFEKPVLTTSNSENNIPPTIIVVEIADNLENEGPPSVFNNQGTPQGIPSAPISNPSVQELQPLTPVPPVQSGSESNIPPSPIMVVEVAENHENEGPPSVFNNQGTPQGIPSAPINNPSIQELQPLTPVPPAQIDSESTIPPSPIKVVEVADNHENEGPPSVFNNQGTPQGIPSAPINNPSVDELQPLRPVPPVQNDNTSGFPPATELPRLTPVPDSEKQDNYNFGPSGLFQEPCTTVDNEFGSCISLLSCDIYLKVVKQSTSNPAAVNLLRKAHCGFEGNNPKVCCPRPGFPSEPIQDTTTTTTTPAPQTDAPQPTPQGRTDDFVDALPSPPECGISNASFGRIIGGIDAHLGDFPWMALLGYKPRRGAGARWLCGGTLVTSRHVLTAAHCIHLHEDDLFLVRLGELDLAKEDDGATPMDVLIKKKIKHEEYSPTSFANDIGVLVLDRHVPFSHLIKPVCLPVDNDLRARSFVDYNPIVTGWGATEFRGPSATHLQALQLPVVSNDFCAQAYSAYKQQKIDSNVICAGYKAGGKDACQGDSGGPLVQPIWNPQEVTTYFYQIGVVSFGRKCAEAGFPGVYSRVTEYIPWLQEKLVGSA